jgi:hypothetical protein
MKVTEERVTVFKRRNEYNPIAKLKRIKLNLNQELALHYDAIIGLKDLAIIPVLCFWSETINQLHQQLKGDNEVFVTDKNVVRNPLKLKKQLIMISSNYYSEVFVKPPNISIEMLRNLNTYIDLSVRVGGASGKIEDHRKKPTDIGDKHSILDKYQERTVFKPSLGHQLLGGVTGTGKTIVLLGRASWYARQYPKEKQLFIVYQIVLSDYLKQKYKHQYANYREDLRNLEFNTFGGWFKSTYDDVYEKIESAKQGERDAVIDKLVEQALKGTLKIKDSRSNKYGKPIRYGHIYVDEAHQMHTSWIRLLTKFAKLTDYKPNIWIAYDNGQGIYRDRKFIGKDVGLNLRGRSQRLHRIYRCGMIPWIFAACCYPEAMQTYRDQSRSEFLEFTRRGNWPRQAKGNTLRQQAVTLKKIIKKIISDENYALSDVVIFYAVAGFLTDASDKNEMVKEVLDEIFKDLGGIEWVAINKGKAEWTSDKIRACSFTSSQGIDAPITVFFSAESFNIFRDDSWVNREALFYTVLTRATDTIIITYKELKNDQLNASLSALFKGFNKAKAIKERINKIKTTNDNDGSEIYRIKWKVLDSYINK